MKPPPDLYPDKTSGSGRAIVDITTPDERLGKHLEQLSIWATENEKDSKRDFVRFWSLKIPAIVTALLTSVASLLKIGNDLVAVTSAVSAACITIDSLWPGGLLYNVHKRAVHDIRILKSTIVAELDNASISYENNTEDYNKSIKGILTKLSKERIRIAKYLAEAETSLGKQKHR